MPRYESASTAAFVEAHRVLLSREEEVALFQKWYAAEGRVKDAYLSQIVRAYSPIIKATIREFSGYHADPEELVSEGLMALVQAAQRYDLSTGFRFSTFAKRWVHGVMLGFITKNYFPVNLCTSHNKKKLFFAIRRIIASNLKASGSFEMTQSIAEELSEEFNVSERDVYTIYEMIRKPPVSLTDPVHNEEPDGLTRQDYVEDNLPTAEELIAEHDRHGFQKRIIDKVINTVLDDRERKIFEAQVLSPKDEDSYKTLEELGEDWNVSRERVRQIRNKARDRVRDHIVAEFKKLDVDISDVI